MANELKKRKANEKYMYVHIFFTLK